MGHKIKSVTSNKKISSNVTNNKEENDDQVTFTFNDFKITSINIEGEFNNFYKNEQEFIRKISTFLFKCLPMLSNETVKSLNDDISKKKTLHYHKVKGKSEILRKILESYQYPQEKVEQIIEGENIYEFEMPEENGASRIVMEMIDSTISILFMDCNHHIYFNKDKVDEAGSLFYEFCPVYEKKACDRMDYIFKNCFAAEFLDYQKYKDTYLNKYSPVK